MLTGDAHSQITRPVSTVAVGVPLPCIASDGASGKPNGAIAQLGERLLCKQEVVGSIPSGSTKPFPVQLLNRYQYRALPWALFFADCAANRTLALTNRCLLFLLNLGNELTLPALLKELAEVVRFLRASKFRASLNSLKIFKPGSE